MTDTSKKCNSQYGYCIGEELVSDPGCEEIGCKYVYHVVTSVSISLPVINVIAPNLEIFRVAGVTSAVNKKF